MAEPTERPGAESTRPTEAPRRPEGGRRAAPSRLAAVKTRLWRAVVENAALKFVAFVLALTVFILVQSQDEQQIGINVRVGIKEPPDRVLVSERVDQVRITVKGSRRAIRRLDESKIRPIEIDLTGHRRSELVFDSDQIQLPPGVEIVRFTPPSILTRFERRVRKEVPVEVQKFGEVAQGFIVTGVVAVPERVVISGAESVVEATPVVKTREVALGGRTSTIKERVELVPPEAVDLVPPDEREVRVEIAVTEEQASLPIGPLIVAVRAGPAVSPESAERFEAKPGEVAVILRGSRLAVEAVEPERLAAYVEISADDVATGRTRAARVVVPTPAKGIAVEIVPEEVAVGLK